MQLHFSLKNGAAALVTLFLSKQYAMQTSMSQIRQTFVLGQLVIFAFMPNVLSKSKETFSSASVPSSVIAELIHLTGQCSFQGTTTVNDGLQISSCTTFSGSIALATESSETFDLGAISVIDGDLAANDSTALTELRADALMNITGSFYLEGLDYLSTINMQKLSNVGQEAAIGIDWRYLPVLQTVSFGAGLDEAATVYIESTSLSDVSPLNLLNTTKVQLLNNYNLTALHWRTKNVSNGMFIVADGFQSGGINITLDSLVAAGSLTITNASNISLKMLQELGSLSLDSGTFGSFSVPNLLNITDIDITNCLNLTSVDMPLMQTCGQDLDLLDNPILTGDLQFSELTYVGGTLNITGNYSSVAAPKLSQISGGLELRSAQDITKTCNSLTPLVTDERATIVCEGNDKALASAASSASLSMATQTGTGNGSGPGLSSGGIAGLVLGVMAAATILTSLQWIQWRRRSQRRPRENPISYSHEKPELSAVSVPWWRKWTDRAPAEVSGSATISELPGAIPTEHLIPESPLELPGMEGVSSQLSAGAGPRRSSI